MSLWRDHMQQWAAPLALLIITLLSYGLWIPWLGMYGDDLPYLWYFHLLGPWGPGEFASMDRPASSIFYAAVTLVFGEHVWLYHVFLLVLRWVSGLLFWWVLRMVWPEKKQETILAAAFFVVYPGFRQNPVALEFILHVAILDLFLLSLGTMLLSVSRSRKRFLWLAISLVTAFGPFFLEYFVGLEILRPLFLWFLTRRLGMTGKKQYSRILLAWVPALGVVLVFLYWRIFIFTFRTYQPVLLTQLRADFLGGLRQLGIRIVGDLWISFGDAWSLVFHFPQNTRWLVQDLLLVGVCFVSIFLLLGLAKQSDDQPSSTRTWRTDRWGEIVFGIGFLSMLAGGVIFWVTGIPVSVEFPWDRSTLSLMLGASLVMAGLLNMLIAQRYRLVVAVIIVSLAVGLHFQNALVYRAEWKKLQSFFWQLTWRAPALKPGTLILFDVIPLNRYSDNDLTALLNWTYAPDLNTRHIPYKFFDITIRLGSEYEGLPGLEKDLPVEHNHRGLFFETTTSQTLAVHYDPPGCLVVLSPNDGLLPGLPGRLPDVLSITDLDQIFVNEIQARPPEQLGEEPDHDWCYFFQKAGLAHQQEDWQELTALGEQAAQAGLHWNDPIELLPFIEGYARSGDWEKARQLTTEAIQTQDLQPSLCMTWKLMGQEQDSEFQSFSSAVQTELGCTP